MNRRFLFRAVGAAGAATIVPTLPAISQTSAPIEPTKSVWLDDEPWTGAFEPAELRHQPLEGDMLTIAVSPAEMNGQIITGKEALELCRMARIRPKGIRCADGRVFVIPPGERRIFVMTNKGLMPVWT